MSCPFAWRGMISGSLHHGSLDDDALGDVLPEGHEQLARQRHDRALAAALAVRLEPLGQCRLRLVAHPQPGELDHRRSQAWIAGLRHALLALDTATAPWRGRKTGIGRNLAAVGELPVEGLRPENGSEVRAQALQGEQHRDRIRCSLLAGWLALGQQRLLLALHRRDLVEQQFETIELAADLGFQMSRQQASVPRPQGLEPRPSISPYRRVVGYSLREQKPLDPVPMLETLPDECPSLPAKPAAVLFFRRGRNHHRADPRLAALVGQKS